VTRAIRAAVAALVAAVLLSMAVGAQETTTPAGAGFRADTEPDLLGRRGPAIVGWLYNDGNVAVSNVRLRAEVLDGASQTVASGEAYVYGNVPARGRGYFFVPVPRYGDRYRVTVLRYDRLEVQ
jgi:hypothetical protein